MKSTNSKEPQFQQEGTSSKSQAFWNAAAPVAVLSSLLGTDLTMESPVVHTHAEQFRTAMESYQESIKGCGVQALDLKATHSWESVLRLAKDVEKDYVNAGKKGPRRFARLLGNQAQEKVSYLKLIPNDLYASIVAGGLKIIFQVCH